MTSKELIEILNKTRRTQNISLTSEQVEELINDLEILEQYEAIFKEPLKDIRERLQVLEILKEYLKTGDVVYYNDTTKKLEIVNGLYLKIEQGKEMLTEKEKPTEFKMVKEWLDGKD